MISRLAGLVRDVALAALPAGLREPFIIAFRFPNTLRDIIGEGAMNAAFVPVYSETLEKDSKEAFQDLVSACLGMMILVLGVVTLVGMIVAPWLTLSVNSLTPLTGSDPKSVQELTRVAVFTRWCFPYIFFIGLAVFTMGPLFAMKRYATSAWTPAILNVTLAFACAVIFWPNRFGLVEGQVEPMLLLIVAVWLGGILHVAVQFAAMRKHTGVLWPTFQPTHPGVKKVLWLMVPVVIGQSAGEVNKLVDLMFANALPIGAVTALTFANRLVQLPLGIFGVATSVAILPIVSRAVARADFEEARATLLHGLRQSAFLVLPATLGLLAVGEPIVRLLFQRGNFTQDDVARTTVVLVPFAISLIAFAWVKVCLTGFYARHDTKTPVVVSAISMILNIVLNIILIRPLGYQGLALSTMLAQFVNLFALYWLLGRAYGPLFNGDFISGLTRIVAAGILMAAVAYGVYVRIAAAMEGDSFNTRLITVAIPVGVAIVVYVGAAYALRIPELDHFLDILRRRRGQSNTTG